MAIKLSERTTYAVWEITLKCNLACSHCGSRAGDSRVDELSTAEAFDLVHQMADIGIKEISLIGGEAFLRHDWLDIAREIKKSGIVCTMTTGGFGISASTAHRMKEAGISRVSVSVDGLEAVHDQLRGKPGSWKFCFKTIKHLRDAGIVIGTNTQINRLSAPELPLIYQSIRDAGVRYWQLQLTVPMGNAADNAHILLQPSELLDIYPMIAYLATRGKEEGVSVQPGNNIGYYGPYERLLRARGVEEVGEWAIWSGCEAGQSVLGIEADGKIKGCPSLPSSAYTGGNIRERRLRDIFDNTAELRFNDTANTPQATDHLWGFCRTCRYAALCRGGCSWTAHVFFDRRGNNPYCHHRSLTQAKRGIRERVFVKTKAPGTPFDNGVFTLVEEPMNSPFAGDDPLRFTAEKIQWPAAWLEEEPSLVVLVAQEKEDVLAVYQ
jgi:nif11-class peptide radical SAM maturase 3